MKFKFIIIMLCLSSNIFSQYAYFSSTKYLKDNRAERYSWYINNQKISPKDTLKEIRLNYPRPDTLVFKYLLNDVLERDTIFTRFSLNQKYIFGLGCCNDGYQIYESEKYIQFKKKVKKTPENFHDYRFESVSVGHLNIQIINNKDSLVVFPDIFIDFVAYITSTNDTYNNVKLYGSPFTNLMYDVHIYKHNSELIWIAEEEKFITYDEQCFFKLRLLSKYKVRVFEGDHPTLIYDCSENKFSLNY